MVRRPRSIRLRGCERHAREPLARAAAKPCRHDETRRLERRVRQPSSVSCRAARPVAVPLLGFRVEHRRRRIAADLERRPSEPPHCTKRRPPPPLSRRDSMLVPRIVCILSGVAWVVALLVGGLTRGPG